jgi:hypothetical protein
MDALMRELTQRVEKMETAFPQKDYDGHRRAHEAFIERTAEIRRLRIVIAEKTIAGLVWAGMLALGMGFWEILKHRLTGN